MFFPVYRDCSVSRTMHFITALIVSLWIHVVTRHLVCSPHAMGPGRQQGCMMSGGAPQGKAARVM